MLNCPNTPIIVQLLSTTLSRFMEITKLNGQRWTKRRVADFISSSEEISGEFGETTLGRFLNSTHPQQPSDQTVSAIAQFLILQRAISPHQIELAHRSSPYWKSNNFAEAFDPPQTQSYRSFLQDLSGRYAAMRVEARTLLLCDIILEYLPTSNILIIYETMSVYKIIDLNFLGHKTCQFDPLYVNIVDQYLKQPIAKLELSYSSTGFVTASASLVAFFNKPAGRGFMSVFNVSNLLFSQHEQMFGFKGTRNTGWKPGEPGRPETPLVFDREATKPDAVKYLSTDLSFYKIFSEKDKKTGNTESGSGSKKTKHSKDFSFDTELVMTGKKDNSNNINTIEKPDNQLVSAFLTHDLELFIDALNNGANPNTIPTGYTDPMIFPLARDGSEDWILPLIHSGRCDFALTDQHGFLPSHAPGVTSRILRQSGDYGPVGQRFSNVSLLLQQEEINYARSHGFNWADPDP